MWKSYILKYIINFTTPEQRKEYSLINYSLIPLASTK